MKRTVIRLPPELVERLDKLGARVCATSPGRSCSRARLVRTLITPELEAAEREGDGFDKVARRAIPPLSKRRRTGPD
jgi:predicted transcriptional regulator